MWGQTQGGRGPPATQSAAVFGGFGVTAAPAFGATAAPAFGTTAAPVSGTAQPAFGAGQAAPALGAFGATPAFGATQLSGGFGATAASPAGFAAPATGLFGTPQPTAAATGGNLFAASNAGAFGAPQPSASAFGSGPHGGQLFGAGLLRPASSVGPPSLDEQMKQVQEAIGCVADAIATLRVTSH
jgi:nuclear pore complex protein Nup98-Nup96